MSNLENETQQDYATFDHFGRTWKVPNKRHASHIRYMRDAIKLRVGSYDFMIAEAFLSPTVSKSNLQEPDQFEALMDIDPDESGLDEFTDALSAAMGLGGSGNSSPSSASS